MLQYEQERTQFAMRIERGRNLPAKDLSSQTSDPYVLVSTIPDWNNEGTKKSSTVNGNTNKIMTTPKNMLQTLIISISKKKKQRRKRNISALITRPLSNVAKKL